MFRASQRNHRKTVGKRREMLFQFVGRPAGRNEMNFVKIEAPVGRASDGQVTVVDGIKGSTENSDATRMLLCSGAVGLRGGQCFSGSKVAAHSAGWAPCRNSLMIFCRRLLAAHWLQARWRGQKWLTRRQTFDHRQHRVRA